jgi:hypothetical protein
VSQRPPRFTPTNRRDAEVSFFFGITIAMFWDERDHPVPHFHAEYAGRIASIDLDGTVLAGSLSGRQLRLVREWTEQHHEELLANWERARRNEPLERIEPLS